jgi:hypothetical protein
LTLKFPMGWAKEVAELKISPNSKKMIPDHRRLLLALSLRMV